MRRRAGYSGAASLLAAIVPFSSASGRRKPTCAAGYGAAQVQETCASLAHLERTDVSNCAAGSRDATSGTIARFAAALQVDPCAHVSDFVYRLLRVTGPLLAR